MRDHQQDDAERQPINAQYPGAETEPAASVHVAQRFGGGSAIIVKRVRIAQIGEKNAYDEIDEEQAPADIFIRTQCLEKYREDSSHQHLDRHRYDEPAKIAGNAKIGRAFYQLEDKAGCHCDQVDEQQDDKDREDLGNGDDPIRRRRRIDDLADFYIALAPDEFAAVKDRDDQKEKREARDNVCDDICGERVRRRAVERLGQPKPGCSIDDPKQQQHNQTGAAQYLHDLSLQSHHELSARRRSIEALCRLCQRNLRRRSFNFGCPLPRHFLQTPL